MIVKYRFESELNGKKIADKKEVYTILLPKEVDDKPTLRNIVETTLIDVYGKDIQKQKGKNQEKALVNLMALTTIVMNNTTHFEILSVEDDPDDEGTEEATEARA